MRPVRIHQTTHAKLQPVGRPEITFTGGVSDQVLDLDDHVDAAVCRRLEACLGARIEPVTDYKPKRKPRSKRGEEQDQ